MTSNQGSILALQNRLRGVGRRTTAPVLPSNLIRNKLDKRYEDETTKLDILNQQYTPSICELSKDDETQIVRSRASSSSSRIQSASRAQSNIPTSIPSTPTSASRHRRMNTFLVAQRVDNEEHHDEPSHLTLNNAIKSNTATNPITFTNTPSSSSSGRQLLRQGWLKKCSHGVFGLWRLRLFQLYTDALLYSEKPVDHPQKRINLDMIQSCARPVDSNGRAKGEGVRFDIEVVPEPVSDPDVTVSANVRTIHLEATNASECEQWISAINQARYQLINQSFRSRRTSPSPSVDRRQSHSRYRTPWSNDTGSCSPHQSSIASAVSTIPHVKDSRSSTDIANHNILSVQVISSTEMHRTASTNLSINVSATADSPSHRSMISSPSITPITWSSQLSTSTLTDYQVARAWGHDVSNSIPPLNFTSTASELAVPSPMASSRSTGFFDGTTSWDTTGRPSSVSLIAMDTAIQIVHSYDDLSTFIVTEIAEPDNYYLMHVTRKPTTTTSAADACSCHEPYQRMSEIDHFSIQRQLYIGETSDTYFSISTPAFRPSDSIAQLLTEHRHLPESVVKHCAVYLVLALTKLHEHDLAYPMLSATSVAIDGEGRAVLRDIAPICPLSLSSACGEGHFGARTQLEYTTPLCADDSDITKSLDHHSELSRAQADDWWRFGVLLYEMATGLPPVRSDCTNDEERRLDVMSQLEEFHPLSLRFPSFVSADFESFVRQLLMPERSLRLGCGDLIHARTLQDALDNFRKHDWLRGMAWGQIDKWNASNAPGWIRKNVLDMKEPSQAIQIADIHRSQSLNQSIHHSVSRRSRHSHNRSLSSNFSPLPQHQRQRSDFHMSFVRPLSKQSSLSATPHAGNVSPILGPVNSHPTQNRSSRSDRPSDPSNFHSLPTLISEMALTRRRPPVRTVRKSTKSSSCRLIMTIIGARHLPSPKVDDECATLSRAQLRSTRSKRLTWSKDKDPPLLAGTSSVVSVTQNESANAFIPQPLSGVFCAVKCCSYDGSESRIVATPLVTGAAVNCPLFQEEFAFDLPLDSVDHRRVGTSSAHLMIDIRHANIGHSLVDREANTSLGTLVGSVDIRVKSLQVDVMSHRDDPDRSSNRTSRSDLCSIWHSVIDAHGVPVGELHVQYLCYESMSVGESSDSPELFDMISDHSDHSFQSLFKVCLDSCELRHTGALNGV